MRSRKRQKERAGAGEVGVTTLRRTNGDGRIFEEDDGLKSSDERAALRIDAVQQPQRRRQFGIISSRAKTSSPGGRCVYTQENRRFFTRQWTKISGVSVSDCRLQQEAFPVFLL